MCCCILGSWGDDGEEHAALNRGSVRIGTGDPFQGSLIKHHADAVAAVPAVAAGAPGMTNDACRPQRKHDQERVHEVVSGCHTAAKEWE